MSDGRTPTGSDAERERWREAQRAQQASQGQQPPAPSWQQGQQPNHAQQPNQGQQPNHGQQPNQGQWAQGRQPGQAPWPQPNQGQQGPGQQGQGQQGQGQQGQGQGQQSQWPRPNQGQQSNQGQQPNQGQQGQQYNPGQPSAYRQAPGQPPQNPQPTTPQPTQQYPRASAPTAATERLGSMQPGQNRAQGGPGQGYPVQYAAGPGQQHSTPQGQQNTAAYPSYGQQAGSPSAKPDTKKRRVSWGTAVVAALVGAAAATLLTLAVSGQFVRPVFTGSAVEDDVQAVLQDEYGLPDVQDVNCPEEPSASPGAEFACGFTTGDRTFSVQIRVLDSGGQYLVGAVSAGK